MNSKSKMIKKALLVFLLMVGAITLFSALPQASAVGTGLIDSSNPIEKLNTGTAGETTLTGLVLTVINYFLGFLGLIAVIMVIYGGVSYVTSAGNDEAVGKAKKIIMYALIGLIIILLSFVVVKAILGAGTATE